MKIKRALLAFAVPVIATFLFAFTAHAATPILSLSVSSGDSVQVTVTGDPNSSVNFFYNIGSSSGMQTRTLGTTDSSGHLSILVSTSVYGVNSGASTYVVVNSQQSGMSAWPYTSGTTSGTLSLSQNNLTLSIGQTLTLSASGGSNSFYISNNSNPGAVSFVLSGTQITATGNAAGTTSATICDQNNLSNCVTLSATTQNTGTTTTGQAITFGQNNVSVASGNGTIIVSISGGSNYTITSNSNSGALNASIYGSSIDLSANGSTPASAAVTVCSSGTTSCGTLNVSINGGTITSTSGSSLSLSQSTVTVSPGTSQSVTISGSGTYSVSSNSNSSIISPSINGNTLTLYALPNTSGSATITICQQSGGCSTLTATAGTGSQIVFSQSSPSLTVGQSLTITVSGGSGSYFISSNPSPGVVSASLNGASLVLSGVASGSDAISVCGTSGGCSTLTATVAGSSQTSSAISFSQTNPTLTVGQTTTITLSGGTGSYFLSSAASSVVQTSINGTILTLSGQSSGSAALSVCSSAGGCGILTVTVNAVASTTPTIVTTPTITSTTPLNITGLKSILAQIQQLTTLLAQLETQALAELQQLAGSGASISTGIATANTSYKFSSYLSPGSTGAEVTALQQRLTAEGVYTGSINGVYGSATESAVRAYQTSHGISPLGVVGPATRTALNGY